MRDVAPALALFSVLGCSKPPAAEPPVVVSVAAPVAASSAPALVAPPQQQGAGLPLDALRELEAQLLPLLVAALDDQPLPPSPFPLDPGAQMQALYVRPYFRDGTPTMPRVPASSELEFPAFVVSLRIVPAAALDPQSGILEGGAYGADVLVTRRGASLVGLQYRIRSAANADAELPPGVVRVGRAVHAAVCAERTRELLPGDEDRVTVGPRLGPGLFDNLPTSASARRVKDWISFTCSSAPLGLTIREVTFLAVSRSGDAYNLKIKFEPSPTGLAIDTRRGVVQLVLLAP